MKRLYALKIVLPVFVVALMVMSCASQECQVDYKTVDVATFDAGIKDADILILDVRTPQEYASGHIPGSVNIDYFDSEIEAKLQQLDADTPVFIYCKSGNRSGKASAILKKLCFKKVQDLQGGITAWAQAQMPME